MAGGWTHRFLPQEQLSAGFPCSHPQTGRATLWAPPRAGAAARWPPQPLPAAPGPMLGFPQQGPQSRPVAIWRLSSPRPCARAVLPPHGNTSVVSTQPGWFSRGSATLPPSSGESALCARPAPEDCCGRVPCGLERHPGTARRLPPGPGTPLLWQFPRGGQGAQAACSPPVPHIPFYRISAHLPHQTVSFPGQAAAPGQQSAGAHKCSDGRRPPH